jgi:hypothetical integral membrane protein (TIGR02206 family)
LHLSLIGAIAIAAATLAILCRYERIPPRPLRLILGYGLALNEIIWWIYRYSREGVHLPNLPLQLCDATVWTSVLACLTLRPALVEFTYFAGTAGAGMALVTPDLVFPWPSYPAFYFFLAHGGIVIAIAVLVFGGIAPLRRGAVWRAFGMLLAYALVVGLFDAASGANYMYLRGKPGNRSLLDAFGPWPWYLFVTAAVTLALFWLLWLPVRPRPGVNDVRSACPRTPDTAPNRTP